jgi:hypothetical protein
VLERVKMYNFSLTGKVYMGRMKKERNYSKQKIKKKETVQCM